MTRPGLLVVLAALLFGGTGMTPAFGVPVGVPGDGERASTPAASLSREKSSAGYNALGRADLNAAQKAFVEAARIDPRAAAPLLGLAEVARLKKQPAEVEKWLNKAREVAPKNPDVQRAWGRYQFALRNWEAAETALKKAAELDPESALTQLDLGDLYMQGPVRLVNAAEAYRRAIQLKPEHAGAHNGLGAALAAQGRTSEAEAEFEAAARLAPENPLPLLALGALYKSVGDSQKGLQAYSRALKIQPDLISALLDRGELYMLRRESAEALADYSKAAKLAPRNAVVQFRLGTAYHSLAKFDEARRYYGAAIAADANYAVAYNNLAALDVYRKSNLDGALRAAKRAVQLAPNVAEYHDTLGSVYLARGDLDSAIAEMRIAATGTPPDADQLYRLGLALAEKGNKPDAVDAFRKALTANPAFAHADDAVRKIRELDAK